MDEEKEPKPTRTPRNLMSSTQQQKPTRVITKL
jgi:hypothetical protein